MFRGWWIALTLAVAQPVTWGIVYYAFPVFLEPMQNELGWSRTELTGAFSIALLVSGVASVPIGWWLDARGARLLLTVGSIATALLVFAWAHTTSLAVFYLIWAGLGLCMAATFYEPAFALVTSWFSTYRSRALTLVTFGGGFASVIFIPLAGELVKRYDWRDVLTFFAVLIAFITVPLYAIVIRNRPADAGECVDGDCSKPQPEPFSKHSGRAYGAALRSPAFRWISIAFAFTMFVNAATMIHTVPLLIDRGESASYAAFATGAIGLMALPGRLILTPLGDWLPRWSIPAVIFLVQSIALSILALTTTNLGVWIFVILFGIGFGAITPARAALVADLFGVRIFAGVSGVLAMTVAFSRALGPVAASAFEDLTGNYDVVLLTLAVMNVVAALCVARTASFSQMTTADV